MKFTWMHFLLLLFSLQSHAQNACEELQQKINNGDLDGAIEMADQYSGSSQVQCINLVGEAYLKKGRNTIAKSYFEKALALAKDNTAEKATCLNNLGIAYWNDGNDNLGREYLFQALTIRQNLFGDNHEKTAASFNDLGLIFSASDPDQALKYYEKALEIYQQLDGDHKAQIAQSNLNIGIIYRQLELYGDAIVNLNNASMIWHQIYPDGHPNEGFVYLNQGITNLEMGFKDKALDYYEKALKIYLDHYGNKHPEVAYVYNLMGNIYHGKEEFDEALSYYQKALISNSGDFSDTNPETNPTLDHIYNTNTLLSTLYAKSQAFMDRSIYFTLSFNDLKSSLELLYSCDKLIDYLRIQATNESDKIALGNSASKVYETGAFLCHYMANETFSGDQYLKQSFYFAEKSKSAVLLEAIADASAKSYANIPDSELEKERHFTTDIAYYEQLLAKKPDDSLEKEYRSQLFKVKQTYSAFVSSLEQNYPKYFDLKYNVKVPSIEEIQKTLDEETMVLSYFLTSATSSLFIYEITKDDYEVHSIVLDEEFNRNMKGLRNAIRYQVFDLFQSTSQELYKILFPFSISKDIEKIVVIPNDKLGTIPYNALLTKKSRSKEENYAELPYLIKDYSISYQYSSALFYQNKMTESSKNNQRTVFLCAPVYFNGVPDLPATSREIEELDQIFASKSLFPQKYLESEASEDVVKSAQLKNFAYLHFATHGYVDEINPELSRLLLHEKEGSPEDGNLYSGEIYNLNLTARLVTLSACETGLGKISKGEGIIGLSRAFAYAGAENIMVSLWIVSDESTSKLMIDFYSQLDENNYSNALRSAQLSLINDTEFAKPYYWAAFILVGQ